MRVTSTAASPQVSPTASHDWAQLGSNHSSSAATTSASCGIEPPALAREPTVHHPVTLSGALSAEWCVTTHHSRRNAPLNEFGHPVCAADPSDRESTIGVALLP